jgi:hypothetical protein
MYDYNKMSKMREAIKKPYGYKWHKRVNKMTDKQILAIYKRFVKDGVIKPLFRSDV